MSRRGRRIGVRRLLVGVSGFTLTAVLSLFHGRLLWQRLIDGSLLQPVVVVRWLLSALLIIALLKLWSRGLPLVRGRRAGVVWLVVVLLHAFTPGGSLPAVEPVAEGILPAALALLAFVAFGWAVAPEGDSIATRRFLPRQFVRPHQPSSGWYRVLFSRPPPVSLHP